MKLRVFSIISASILVICATYTIVGSFCTYNGIWQTLFVILSNPFVSGVIYTVCLLFIVFDVQITISKKMIKKDFRCNEIMEDAYEAIINYKI